MQTLFHVWGEKVKKYIQWIWYSHIDNVLLAYPHRAHPDLQIPEEQADTQGMEHSEYFFLCVQKEDLVWNHCIKCCNLVSADLEV